MREHMGIGATENKITKEENIMENKWNRRVSDG